MVEIASSQTQKPQGGSILPGTAISAGIGAVAGVGVAEARIRGSSYTPGPDLIKYIKDSFTRNKWTCPT